MTKLKVNEIFKSIQGESTYAGRLCIFIRLTGCNLRCAYCDTPYAYFDGEIMSVDEIMEKIKVMKIGLVEITGGEPLLQKGIGSFVKKLLAEDYKVLIETNGSISLNVLSDSLSSSNLCIILDIKTPGSSMADKMALDNLALLRPGDETKFVIGSTNDYQWSCQLVEKFKLKQQFTVNFSPVFGMVTPDQLAQWMIRDEFDVRLNIQLHKIIWPDTLRGV